MIFHFSSDCRVRLDIRADRQYLFMAKNMNIQLKKEKHNYAPWIISLLIWMLFQILIKASSI